MLFAAFFIAFLKGTNSGTSYLILIAIPTMYPAHAAQSLTDLHTRWFWSPALESCKPKSRAKAAACLISFPWPLHVSR